MFPAWCPRRWNKRAVCRKNPSTQEKFRSHRFCHYIENCEHRQPQDLWNVQLMPGVKLMAILWSFKAFRLAEPTERQTSTDSICTLVWTGSLCNGCKRRFHSEYHKGIPPSAFFLTGDRDLFVLLILYLCRFRNIKHFFLLLSHLVLLQGRRVKFGKRFKMFKKGLPGTGPSRTLCMKLDSYSQLVWVSQLKSANIFP